MTLVAGGSGDIGVSRLPGEILDVVTRLPAAVEALTGVSVTQVRPGPLGVGTAGHLSPPHAPSVPIGCPEETRVPGLSCRVPEVPLCAGDTCLQGATTPKSPVPVVPPPPQSLSPWCHHPQSPISPKCHHLPVIKVSPNCHPACEVPPSPKPCHHDATTPCSLCPPKVPATCLCYVPEVPPPHSATVSPKSHCSLVLLCPPMVPPPRGAPSVSPVSPNH